MILTHGIARTKKSPAKPFGFAGHKSGDDLLSREIPVSSALESLTTVFDMGTGVTSPEEPPENRIPPQGYPVFCCECNKSILSVSSCIVYTGCRVIPARHVNLG